MTAPLSPVPAPAEPTTIHLGIQVTPDELARHALALANTRGGVIVVGGVAPDGSRADASDLHPLQVTHAIFALSGGRLTVNVQHQALAGGERQLVVYVPQAHYLLAAPDGSVLGWDGERTVPVSPAHAPPQAEADYTATVPPTASLADLDPVEVSRLRGVARGNLSQLPDLDLLRELGLIVGMGASGAGEERPNIAALLLLGTARALKAHIPQAEVCYYHHATSDPDFSFREDMLRPLLATLTRTAELVQARNAFTPVQVGLFRIEVWDYDEAVYREALLNALTHRDYQLRDVVHVHQYPERLEISNPGGFPGGITPQNILRHQPKRRNPLLAEVLAKLGLVERAGVGVDKMYQLMLKHGKELPEYTAYPDAVTLLLHNPGFDADFVRFVARKQEQMQTLSLDMLMVLSRLGREGVASRLELSRALQLPEDRTPRLLQMMGERGLLTVTGRGRESEYQLSDEVRTAMGRGHRLGHQRGQEPPEQPRPAASTGAEHRPPNSAPRWHALTLHLAEQPGGVGNALLRQASGLSMQSAWRVLRQLTLSGQLRREGSSPRQIRYFRSG
ncbi:ATP-binding protein [Deinococcus altitudinis]|uniref:ATP-binding protein n=1 Tax=Deinococcus altitudinis TaxID=468914 RepID=UPI003891B996